MVSMATSSGATAKAQGREAMDPDELRDRARETWRRSQDRARQITQDWGAARFWQDAASNWLNEARSRVLEESARVQDRLRSEPALQALRGQPRRAMPWERRSALEQTAERVRPALSGFFRSLSDWLAVGSRAAAARQQDIKRWPSPGMFMMTKRENRTGHYVMSTLAGMALGAGLVYFMDPQYGNRRRNQVRDRLAEGLQAATDRAARGGREAANQAYGISQRVVQFRPPTAEGEDLPGRVRDALSAANWGWVDVSMEGTTLVLEGQVQTEGEARDIEARVREVPGVLEIRNRLHLPADMAGPATEEERRSRRIVQ